MDLLLGTVFTLSVCWFVLLRLSSHYVGADLCPDHSRSASDYLDVNRTGGVDSYVSNLYFLEIVMSSILLERQGALVAATLSSVMHLAHLDLVKYGAHSRSRKRRSRLAGSAVHHQREHSRFLRGCLPVELSGGKPAPCGRAAGEVLRSDGIPAGLQQPHHR